MLSCRQTVGLSEMGFYRKIQCFLHYASVIPKLKQFVAESGISESAHYKVFLNETGRSLITLKYPPLGILQVLSGRD